MNQSIVAFWIAITLLSGLPGIAQPSSRTEFVFRLYDKGEEVNGTKFCREWSVLNKGGGFISPCDKYAFSHYDSTLHYFFLSVGAIYPPYAFSLIHDTDTMTIYLPPGGYYILDSLTMHPGSFLFDYKCPDKDRVQLKPPSLTRYCPVKKIDWELQRQKLEAIFSNGKEKL